MIKLLVDEGYAFDYLSILEVKAYQFLKEDTRRSYFDCKESILKEFIRLGYSEVLYHQILNSKEYQDLVFINKKVFDAVDKARYGTEKDISAKEVDSLNMERFRLKQAIQNKYFKTKTQEVKN